jgi:hypothetical protein
MYINIFPVEWIEGLINGIGYLGMLLSIDPGVVAVRLAAKEKLDSSLKVFGRGSGTCLAGFTASPSAGTAGNYYLTRHGSPGIVPAVISIYLFPGHDHWRPPMKKFIISAIPLLVFAGGCASPPRVSLPVDPARPGVKYTATVAEKQGLNLRSEENITSKKVGFLPYNAEVEVLGEGKEQTFYNIRSRWLRVRRGRDAGWAFGGFLKPECACVDPGGLKGIKLAWLDSKGWKIDRAQHNDELVLRAVTPGLADGVRLRMSVYNTDPVDGNRPVFTVDAPVKDGEARVEWEMVYYNGKGVRSGAKQYRWPHYEIRLECGEPGKGVASPALKIYTWYSFDIVNKGNRFKQYMLVLPDDSVREGKIEIGRYVRAIGMLPPGPVIIYIDGDRAQPVTLYSTSKFKDCADKADCGKKIRLNENRPLLYVSEKQGLNVREQPNITAKKAGFLPYYSMVELLEVGGEETLYHTTNRWLHVRNEEVDGWAFGGYLKEESEMPPRDK